MDLSRLRKKDYLRDWVSEVKLSAANLILPCFVAEGLRSKREIKAMPGVYYYSPKALADELKKNPKIRAVLLFGVSRKKDRDGSGAYQKEGIVQKTIKLLKKEAKGVVIIADVCLCAYTEEGHCGIIKAKKIDEEATLGALAKIALSQAEAGADLVAPSAMADGQVAKIRQLLDGKGYGEVGILAYSAKYASSFYGPFREALASAPKFGDRKSYQLDFRNSNQALREIGRDIDEGADMVMVKPALAYLDVIWRAKQKFKLPLAAYNVSGEYSMVKKLSGPDKNKEKELALEVLYAIKRAGADFIITYLAKEAARWLD